MGAKQTHGLTGWSQRSHQVGTSSFNSACSVCLAAGDEAVPLPSNLPHLVRASCFRIQRGVRLHAMQLRPCLTATLITSSLPIA